MRTSILVNHFPVMLDEATDMLDIKPHGIYVDGTLGGGGHAQSILDRLTTGRLIGIDHDEEAIAASGSRLAKHRNFSAIKSNFHNLPKILNELEIEKIDGVLLDLGVSSHQIDTARRGFSYLLEGPLDMRMDISSELTAEVIANTYDERQITQILYEYGEEKQAKKISRAICKERARSKIKTTTQLAELIRRVSIKKRGETAHPAMRSFMALRIAVNNELKPLADAIACIVPYLNDCGRIVVITFHSLEDRIVKNTVRMLENPCICPRDIPYCSCGRLPQLKNLTKKPIVPSEAELMMNSRSHSAKLRGAKKVSQIEL